LKKREYLGHIICDKHISQSFKDRSLTKRSQEAWIEVTNNHDAIIDEKVFDEVKK